MPPLPELEPRNVRPFLPESLSVLVDVAPTAAPARSIAIPSGGPAAILRTGALLALSGCVLLPSFDGLTGGGGVTDAAIGDGAPAGDAGASRYRSAVLTDHPIAYWRLGDHGGSSARDEMGAHPGVFRMNAVLGVPGALVHDSDTAMSSPSRDGWVEASGPFDFVGNAPYAVEAWVAPNTSGDYLPIVDATVRDSKGKRSGHTTYVDPGGNVIHQRLNADVFDQVISPVVTVLKSWQYVVASYDGVSMSLYVDGARVDTKNTVSISAAASGAVELGADVDGPKGLKFGGVLDEIAIYDHALDAVAVAAHFKAGKDL
jgi:hypothetical protein